MTINELILRATEIVNNLVYDEDLHEPASIGMSNAGIELYLTLTKVDAIHTVQGTGRVYIGPEIQSNKELVLTRLESLKACLNGIVDKLKEKGDKTLTKAEVIRVIQERSEEEQDYYTFVGILSSLDIVTSAGRSRTGGIKLYDKTEENNEIQKAEQKIEQETVPDEQVKVKAEHESALYPSAAKVLSSLGFETLILGSVRRLQGEWNTPDVLGYRINRYKNIGGAELEVVTIEAKWEISKFAIAEANSHQGVGHKTYLMVHQTFDEVDKNLMIELINKGIGLICKHDTEHKLFIPAKHNNPSKTQIDDFIGQALSIEAIEALKKEIAKHFYSDYLRPLLPS